MRARIGCIILLLLKKIKSKDMEIFLLFCIICVKNKILVFLKKILVFLTTLGILYTNLHCHVSSPVFHVADGFVAYFPWILQKHSEFFLCDLVFLSDMRKEYLIIKKINQYFMQDTFARARTRPSARDDWVSCVQCLGSPGIKIKLTD